MKKTQISVQTIFYILMAIAFVAILIFGINKLFSTGETINERERIEIKNNLKDYFNFCQDPLNKGAKRTFQYNNPKFNTICIVTDVEKLGYGAFKDDFLLLMEG
jgi:hypothetical protein